MVGNPCVLRIVEARIERIVGDSPEAGISSINTGRFLIRVAIRSIKHQPVVVAALHLSLEHIRLAVAIVAIRQEIVPQRWVGKTGIIRETWITISIIRSTRGNSVTNCGIPRRIRCSAPWVVAGCDFIQVDATDQTAGVGAKIRETYGCLEAQLSLEGSIELLHE